MTTPTLSVEAARAVLWLRNHHRPMGELLDEGYLDERRLSWAAERAYDPQIQEAAAVLLATLKAETPAPPEAAPPPEIPPINAGITVEQARATPWPFKPFKNRPLGELVDTRQIGLKDLAYAVENAWDRRVQQAAIVLTAIRLNQEVQAPSSPAGPLKVVSGGESYSESRQLIWTQIQGMLLGAATTLCLVFTTLAIMNWGKHPAPEELWSPVGITAIAILILLTLVAGKSANYLFDLALKKTDAEIDKARKGREGEEQTIEIIRQNLDGNWTLFRNLTLPGKNRGDIDLLLVGPQGLWALEVKNFTGPHRNFGEHWERTGGKRPSALKKSPSRQARDNAVRLADFLRAEGLRQWVEPAVIWANRESPLTVEQPSVAVWTLDRLPEELGNLWQGVTMDPEARQRIEEKLIALCRHNAGEPAEA